MTDNLDHLAGLPTPKLIISDMDGTLLDDNSQIPDSFWPVLEELDRRGIYFAPASGRSYATLTKMFEGHPEDLVYIGDNGGCVAYQGEIVFTNGVDETFSQEIIQKVRALAAEGHDLGVVWCAAGFSYVERRTNERYLSEIDKFFVERTFVDDFDNIPDPPVKIAIYVGAGAHTSIVDQLDPGDDPRARMIISAPDWVDYMSPTANKGKAVEMVQDFFKVSKEETAVFGDFPNDIEMMDKGELSFAVKDAHPEIIAASKYITPSNNDEGVVKVLRKLLRMDDV